MARRIQSEHTGNKHRRSGSLLGQKRNSNPEACYIRLIQNRDWKINTLFESLLADILVNAGTVLIYITGLVGFVAWLEQRGGARRKSAIVETQ